MADEEHEAETTETFVQRFGSIVTHGFVSLAVCLGSQTGLFDVLIELNEEESTVKQIADKAGLKERYVKEWLGIMVCAQIIDINPENEKYRLPPHRVHGLQAGHDSSDYLTLCQAIPMLSSVFHKLKECFKKDGPSGLSYSNYDEFHSFMASLSGRWVRNHLVQDFLPSIPKIQEKLKSGVRVLDLGCGRGVSTLILAENFPNSSITGLDFSEECIAFGSEEARKRNIQNVEFVYCDAAAMPQDWSNVFDYIYVFDVIHDVAYADKVLKEVQRVMTPAGRFSMLDYGGHSKHSENAHDERSSISFTISTFHCLPISMFFKGSLGLGTCWGRERAVQLLMEAGLEVESITTPTSSTQAHYFCSKALSRN